MPQSKRLSTFRLFLALALPALLVLSGCKSSFVERQALYVTCNKGKTVLVYEINTQTGELTDVQRVELPGSVGPFALTDDGLAAYAALNGPPRLLPMQRDPETGKLTPGEPTTVPTYPTYLDIDATGAFAVTASYGQGVVHTHRINPDRSIAQGPVQTTNTVKTAHACLIDPSNRLVYIPHTTPNEIYQFAFDAKEGKLEPLKPLVVKGGGTPGQPQGPRHYTYHPKLGVAYFVNELDSSVSAYAWDQRTGQLQRFQNLSTLPQRFGGRNTCADIHITPDGRFLYASNRGHDSIAAYKLDKDGLMTLIDYFPTEAVPREFALDLNGRFLYAAGLRTNKLAAYAIDPMSGRLRPMGTYDTPEGPIWVEASAIGE